MGMKSPSKFLSIRFLRDLRSNDYVNQAKTVDYVPCEVDSLYFEKLQNERDFAYIKMIREEKLQYLLDCVMTNRRYCVACKSKKSFSDFDKDKRKTLGLRSRCKSCRKDEREGKKNVTSIA